MSYTILSESPTRFEVDEPYDCDDCEQPTTILTDTMAGYLCDYCAKRFHDACCGLVEACSGLAKPGKPATRNPIGEQDETI